MITYESLDLGSSFLVPGYIFMGYGSTSYMKVIGIRIKDKVTGSETAVIDFRMSMDL